MNSLQGKRVTVAGLGLHGGALGTISWLAEQGALITVTDLKNKDELASSVTQLEEFENITLVLGEHRLSDFTQTSLVIRNPGMPHTSEYLLAAKEANVPIAMDSSLFFQHSPSADIIGVTGSKGKTTAATAIAHVLKTANPTTFAVGIDGISPLGEINNIQKNAPIVFELSSWRLEALAAIQQSPATAVVTSIYKEHLNTYDSLEDYIETKKIIIKYQTSGDTAILNYDDAILRDWKNEVNSKLFWFSLSKISDGDGIMIVDGIVRIKKDSQVTEIMDATALPLTQEHAQRNLLPAILIANQRGITPDTIAQALSSLKPLAHRLESIRTVNGVEYINDSAATMPDATGAALKSLTGKKIILILGGSDKQLEFEQLAKQTSQSNLRAIIWLPGTATVAMQAEIKKMTVCPHIETENMPGAVLQAQKIAQNGDTVLLSPGATSFGLFKHEFDRGDQFKKFVLELEKKKAAF